MRSLSWKKTEELGFCLIERFSDPVPHIHLSKEPIQKMFHKMKRFEIGKEGSSLIC